jgi:hypothetical protein
MRAEVKKFVNRCKIFQYAKGKETEHWIISTIAYSREALGCNKHGFSCWDCQEHKEEVIPYLW